MLLLSLPAFLGCMSGFTETAGRDATADANAALVFGRFKMRHAKHGGRIGLAIRHVASGHEHIFPFEKTDDVRAFVVEPGEYKFTEIVYVSALNVEEGRKLFLPPEPFRKMTEIFTAVRGTALYLGDYHASIVMNGDRRIYRFHTIKWEFDSTSRELRARYPNLTRPDIKLAPAFAFDP